MQPETTDIEFEAMMGKFPITAYLDDDYTLEVEDTGPKGAVWNPLDDFYESPEVSDLDISEIRGIIDRSVQIRNSFGIGPECRSDNKTVVGFEAGDDRVDFSRDPLTLAIMLDVQESVVCMSTSKFDTFISKRYYNFCEVTSTIPSAKQQSLNFAKKSAFKHVGFVDSPALRLVMDVKKGNQEHSSSEVGKVSMFGVRTRDCIAELKTVMYIAYFIQSSCLKTWQMEEPAHIPIEMGGCGGPPPWGDYRNLFLSVRTYKTGTYSRVYGTAVNETMKVIQNCDFGKISEPVLAYRLRQRQDYLHGTYSMHVLVPEKQTREELPPPLYKAVGTMGCISGVEKRLVRAKLLLPEKEARKEWDREVRITNVIAGELPVNTVVRAQEYKAFQARKEYGGALRANSAFQNLLRRNATGRDVVDLVKQGFTLVSTGTLCFDIYHAQWLASGAKGEIFSLADLPSSEDMFLRSEISNERTMKIPGITLHPIRSTTSKSVVTVSRLGLWEISKTMEEWADQKVSKLLELRGMYPQGIPPQLTKGILREDPEWVSDDSLIIGRAIEDIVSKGINSTNTIAVVTKDRRLCKQLSQTTGMLVLGINPLSFAFAKGMEKYDATVGITPMEATLMFESGWFARNELREPVLAYVDTGSLEAALQYVEEDPVTHDYYHEELRAVNHDQHRTCTLVRKTIAMSTISERHIIAQPNTVAYRVTAFTANRMPRIPGNKNVTRSQKVRMKKFSH